MRTAAVVALVLAAAALAFVAATLTGPEPETARRPPPIPDGDLPALVEKLARELDRLRGEAARLEDEVGALRRAVRAMAAGAPSPAPGAVPATDEEAGRAALARWAGSFAEGGAGSEYFRLAVEAFAPSLLPEISDLVLDRARSPSLRRQLARMLGGPAFREDPRVAAILLALVAPGEDGTVFRQALESLAAVGGRDAAGRLEGRVRDLDDVALRIAAIEVVAALAADGANEALLRLWDRARSDAERIRIVGLAAPSDPERGLALLERACGAAPPVRLAAANRLALFRGEPVERLIGARLAREEDPRVRNALENARASQRRMPNWHALKATGPANAVPANQDHKEAWATRSPDAGIEWLELTYDPPLAANCARIFEVYTPGAVIRLETVDEDGRRRVVWEGEDPTTEAGVFEVSFPTTSYRVRRLRVVLDTRRRSGWNEIDAVELVGPDGRAWAADATASSIYGQ